MAQLLGLNPWSLAQIEQTDCKCITQQTRNDLIRAIRFAETIFLDRAHVSPVPHNPILEYRKLRGTKVKLKWGNFQQFGTWTYTRLGSFTLDRTNLDVFTLSVTVPAGTTADQIIVTHVNQPAAELLYQIRPLTVSVSSTTATISGPAYLFVRPELYDSTICHPHELDTYVTQVDVHVRGVDACSAGQFVLRNSPCDNPPCGVVHKSACFTYANGWAMPMAAECDENGSFRRYSLKSNPEAVEVSYIAGKPLIRGRMNDVDANLIFMLTVANMDVSFKACDCDNAARERWELYRQVPKTRVQENTPMNAVNWALLFDKEMVRSLRGLNPVAGNLLAIGQIKTLYPQVQGDTL